MKIDKTKSIYHEAPDARNDYAPHELLRLRYLLRRLRFLEAQLRLDSDSTAAQHVAWEIEALVYVLGTDGMEFLAEPHEVPAIVAALVSGNGDADDE